MIDTVIFDCEGPVVDDEHIWDKHQETFLAKRGHKYVREEIKHVIGGKSLLEIAKTLSQIYGLEGNPKEMESEIIENMKRLLAEEVKFTEGFEDFYKEKIFCRYKTGIGTSMYPQLMSVVDRKLNLSYMFSGNIFTIAEVNYVGKPAPDIFLYAARKLDSVPSKCLVIEDAPNGITAAKRAGMKCAAIATTYDKSKLGDADLIFEKYSELDLRIF